MNIRYISLQGRGHTDACLTAAVRQMQAAGLRLSGTFALESDDPSCDMQLQVLPVGPVIRINQNLGKQARGCRLDGGALEQAVMEVASRTEDAQLLIVNKFGKLEASGRGYVPLIAQALERGIGVLIGVNALNLPDLLSFAGDMAQELPPDPDMIAAWALASTRPAVLRSGLS
ncbi:MAG: DUF2478 domain-containing protein [Cypionkella sp.]